jgi:hypothetical protein
MDKATEQKKTYSAPEMKVVELCHQANLLEGSGEDPTGWNGQFN